MMNDYDDEEADMVLLCVSDKDEDVSSHCHFFFCKKKAEMCDVKCALI